jgi:hypothetical protein
MDSWTLDSGTLSGLMTLDSGRSYIKLIKQLNDMKYGK